MTATHTADVYGGTMKLCAIRQDPANPNMVFALVVHDARPANLRTYHTGCRVWIAKAQVTAL